MAELVCELYARPLLEVAIAERVQNEVKEELLALCDVFKDEESFLKLLSSPVLSKDEKQDIITKTFSGQVLVYVENLLRLLAENGRATDFFAITKEYCEMLDFENGVVSITAQTARPLKEELKAKLKTKLESSLGKEVRLSFEVEPSLLGGILIKGGNEQIDATVKTNLNEIKDRIKTASI